MLALISGSSGFIGKHLVKRLQSAGILTEGMDHGLLNFPLGLESYLSKKKFDYIFHLSAYGNHYNQQDPQRIIETNINGTFNLLQATKDKDYKAFINFSTSSVLLPVQTFYSASKASTEYLGRVFANNKPIVSVRPSSVYGEGEASWRFIPKVINSLLLDSPLPVTLEPKHNWIHVDDFIDGLLMVVSAIDTLIGVSVNISTEKQHSNEEIISILERIHGAKLKSDILEKRVYDTDNWEVDNEIIRSLGWKQKISLEEGLKRVYDYERTKNT